MGEVSATHERYGSPWLEYHYAAGLLPITTAEPVTMWRYRALLPIDDGPIRYPLAVGGTPLLGLPGLRRRLDLPELWVKDETRGPTASNKDRATALVIEDGMRRGLDTVTTASTGNAAVATAFGAAAAGMRAIIFVSVDCQPGKLTLMLEAEAEVFRVRRGYTAAVTLSRQAAQRLGWLDRNTGTNPLTIEAKKTVAFEIWEQLGHQRPDVMVIPVGDGPTIGGAYKGFLELAECGGIRDLPRLIGVQPMCCQPLVRAWSRQNAANADLNLEATVADGIAVIRPATPGLVLEAMHRTGGAMLAVDDRAILRAVRMLAAHGVRAEPAGAAALAGLQSALEHGLVDHGERVVVLVTGRGLQAAPSTADIRGEGHTIDGYLDEVLARLALGERG